MPGILVVCFCFFVFFKVFLNVQSLPWLGTIKQPQHVLLQTTQQRYRVLSFSQSSGLQARSPPPSEQRAGSWQQFSSTP